MDTLTTCEKLFGTRDLYKLLEISEDAPPKDIKKAYYKLSLRFHPDRVEEKEKEIATEKFKILSKIYQVLTDEDKRALYNEKGIIDDDDCESKLTSWLDLWRKLFKPLTIDDIDNYQKSYIGSELERSDIKKAYLSCKGCIDKMMNTVPFIKVEDEPRLQDIVGEMIAADEVPEYTLFTKEPAQKRNRRHKKYARESKEADEIKQKMMAKQNTNVDSNLSQMIKSRGKSRANSYNSLMDRLIEKYGGEDDSDPIDFDAIDKKKKKSTNKKINTKSENGAGKSSINSVKSGRVKKRRN